MNQFKKVKAAVYFSLNFLGIVLVISITACTQQTEKNAGKSNADSLKYLAIKNPINSAVEQFQPLTNVASIQKAYNNIVFKAKYGNLDSTFFEYSCYGEKNGTVTYFTEDGQLRLIVHRYNEHDHFSAEDQYFVKDSTLFFTLNKSAIWSFESGPEGSTKDNIKESRTYLANGEPIKCLEKKFVIRSQVKDNPNSEKVRNKNVECPAIETVMKPYLLLTKYRSKPTLGCLDR